MFFKTNVDCLVYTKRICTALTEVRYAVLKMYPSYLHYTYYNSF